jgi:AraC-like DNA-binding protein
MRQYFELRPPADLANIVECFWGMRQTEKSAVPHRVVPDGCADILFTRNQTSAALIAVGAMTRFEDFQLPPQQWTQGVRFLPGMWAELLGVNGDEITDTTLPLEDLWGARARRLKDRLSDTVTPQEFVRLLACELEPASQPTAVQRAIAWMQQRHGQVSLDELAAQCALSARQFRRKCVAHTGLSPKFLARVLRFRHALNKVTSKSGEHAGLAAECGYFDQSHFIAEFHYFSGRTPKMYLSTGV